MKAIQPAAEGRYTPAEPNCDGPGNWLGPLAGVGVAANGSELASHARINMSSRASESFHLRSVERLMRAFSVWATHFPPWVIAGTRMGMGRADSIRSVAAKGTTSALPYAPSIRQVGKR